MDAHSVQEAASADAFLAAEAPRSTIEVSSAADGGKEPAQLHGLSLVKRGGGVFRLQDCSILDTGSAIALVGESAADECCTQTS